MDPTFESTVVSLPFAFWQYNGAYLCGDVPTSAASDEVLWSFLEQVSPVSGGADDSLLWFEPYYWQAYSELGTPGIDTSYLADLLLYDPATIDDLPSIALDPTFEPAAMQDISDWVTSAGQQLLFVYGDSDPWTAGAFELGGAADSYRLTVANGNHYAQIAQLSPGDSQLALDALSAWAGVAASRGSKMLLEQGPALRRLRQLRPR
jgi:hypothetical protein